LPQKGGKCLKPDGRGYFRNPYCHLFLLVTLQSALTANWVGRRPELYAMLGALTLQQPSIRPICKQFQFCFNTQWHFALNITEESDAAKYLSGKTLWNDRNIIATNNLDGFEKSLILTMKIMKNENI
jgi:hypothetical protein